MTPRGRPVSPAPRARRPSRGQAEFYDGAAGRRSGGHNGELAQHRARGAFQDVRAARRIVLPMAAGTVAGSAVGALLVAYAPAGAVKLLLGCVLIGSALRVFKAPSPAPPLN